MAKQTAATQPIYPYSEWEIVEEEFKVENNYRNETVFSLGNGYLGIRGNFEEGLTSPTRIGLEGTYINGFFESEIIRYPEVAFGFPEKSQTMLNITNGKVIKLFVEDEEFSLLTGEIRSYRRTLNLKEGVLERSLIWASPQGREIKLEIKRLVSFAHKHLMAISYQVTPLNFTGKIRLLAGLDGNVTNLAVESDPRTGSGLQGRVLLLESKISEGPAAMLLQRTKHTNFQLACAIDTDIATTNDYLIENVIEDFATYVVYRVNAKQDQPIRLDKFIGYVTSLDGIEEPLPEFIRQVVKDAKTESFEKIRESQQSYMATFWNKADVEIKGDQAIQQGIRFNMFQLLQSVGKDGRSNIAAKGLTGEGYEGHYFWDTEMYVLPFFQYNSTEIARKLLEYRYRTLDRARERARQMSHPIGALYPWRTINGEECSTYFPAGTAQYHINADIAFAIKRYMQATEDRDFLIRFGAEILFETARLWVDLGDFVPRKGNKFCINDVTGPDEYTAIVNNNCYTNFMAQEHLLYAYYVVYWMRENAPEDYNQLVEKIDLKQEEIALWKRAADNMYIPYDEELGIYMQDDSFLDKAPWDFANTPPENYPLLIYYHPLVIYRHQVCKQADFVLALFLLSHHFTQEEKKRNYDFYEKITTHDSSLSTCIFSIVASDIGYREKAYQYFTSTARMDLDDYHGNVKDGVHVANMAGTWMSLVNGFAGMRAYNNVLNFKPYLPSAWEEYSFKLAYKNCLIKITVNQQVTTYELLEGETLSLLHNGEILTLKRVVQTEQTNESQPQEQMQRIQVPTPVQ